jgi:GT2 family glycosyltransferase
MSERPEPAEPRPTVSVVVTARNAQGEIEECLASLLAVDYPPDRHELVIVDNGSTDRTAEIVQRHPVTYLREPRRGVSYARNTGIEATSGEIVALTDTDCVVSTGWLSELAKGFSDQSAGAVAGAIVPYPPRSWVEAYAARRRSHSQDRPLSHPVRPFAMTPNLAFRREPLERTGLFDTRFPGGGWEDADLCWRFSRKTGLALRYAPRAVVFHHYRSTPRDFLIQHYRYGYGLALIHGKYRHELRWGWRERLRAYRDLGGSVLALAKAGAKAALGAGRAADLTTPYLDFLRQLAQRSGFAAGGVRHWKAFPREGLPSVTPPPRQSSRSAA